MTTRLQATDLPGDDLFQALVEKINELTTSSGGGSGAVSVIDHGATRDGVTDDRAAIQTAVDAAIADGSNLFFPAGTYKVEGYVDVNGARGMRIYGAGATILYSSDDTGILLDSVALSNSHARSAFYLRQCSGVEVSDLTFQGGDHYNVSTVNLGAAVAARHCRDVSMRRCVLRGGYSLWIQDATSNATGTGDSLAIASGTVTLTDAAGLFSDGHVGRRVTIAGATDNQANNGSFVITARPSSTSITFTNAAGGADSSTFTWTIDDGDSGTLIDKCVSSGSRGLVYTGSDAVIRDTTFERPMAVDATGIGDSLSISGVTVTLTDSAARFLPQHNGKIITIADATTGANEGTFVVTYISSTQVSFTNAAGVTEPFVTGTWWIANGDKAGVGAGATGLVFSGGNVTLKAALASFVSSDVGKSVRVSGATTPANNGAFVIATYVSATEVTYANSAGVSEAYAGVWSVDAFDRGTLSGDTTGSTHAIYYFAGRSNILVQGCTFRGIRTTCVKVSGSSLPIKNVLVRDNYMYECGDAFVAGADDNQEHVGLVFERNTVVDCATSRPSGTNLVCVNILGSRGSRVVNNSFQYTRNSIGAVDGRTIAGHYGIYANGGGFAGDVQPLEDVVIDGNTFSVDPRTTQLSKLLTYGIAVASCGLSAQFRAGGTLTKSGSTMTLTDAGAVFTGDVVGKYLRFYGAPDATNNGNFTVVSVPSSTTLTFTNAGGVGGAVSAGTWAIARGFTGDFANSFNGECRITRNEIHGAAEVAISTTNCVAPDVTDNSFSNSSIYTQGDCMPRIAHNRMLAQNTASSAIRIFNGTSWPVIHDNVAASRNHGSSTGHGVTVGDSAGDVLDWPLLGARGRSVPTQAKPEVVVAYGAGHIDGDYITVDGTTFTYKASSPTGTQFNSFSGLVALIDALASVTCVDYGSSWSITTQHLKIAATAASATADLFAVQSYSVNQTALVLLYNSAPNTYQSKSRGEGAAGPVADKTVIWSPLCAYEGTASLVADEATARTLLQAGGFNAVKLYTNSGACEVVKHGTSAGTESLRWEVQ